MSALSREESARRLLEYEDSRDELCTNLPVNDLYSYNTALLRECGQDVRIQSNVIIKRPDLVRIGNHVAIEGFFVVTCQFEVGDYCHISYGVIVIGGQDGRLTMGHFSHLAPGCRVICSGDKHMGDGLVSPVVPEQYRDIADCRPVVLGNFATIGTGAVVMPGVTIGDGAVLGANSFANKDLEPWTIYAGSPARPIKKRPSTLMKDYARALGYDL